jgi:hypothetical protein
LKFIEKQYEQAWAADRARGGGNRKSRCLSSKQIREFERRYALIVTQGYETHPHPPPEENGDKLKKRGRPKQTPALNRLDRFGDFKSEVLAFMDDFRVPIPVNESGGRE